MFGNTHVEDKASCHHHGPCTRDCPRYQWWCDQQGKTVRVTQGALEGTQGRLRAVWLNAGEIVHADFKSVHICYEDLEVVRPSSPAPTCCHSHHCCHCEATS